MRAKVNRIRTLQKKARELTILCGVEVGLVCYDANGNLITWPEDHARVMETLRRFKESERRGAAEPQKGKESLTTPYPAWDASFDRLPEEDLLKIVEILDRKLKEVRDRRIRIALERIEKARSRQLDGSGAASAAVQFEVGQCSQSQRSSGLSELPSVSDYGGKDQDNEDECIDMSSANELAGGVIENIQTLGNPSKAP